MKNISIQYQDLQEGKMNKHQFLRNARMMFPNHVTQYNSFEDSVKILKNKGLLNEGDAVKGTPDKAPVYEYPNEKTKYKKVEQSPEVDEQNGIYPATTLTDIPKEKMDKKVKDKSDGLEPIKPNDTKNELKKVKIVKVKKQTLKENLEISKDDDQISIKADSGEYDGFIEDDGTVRFSVVRDDEDFNEDNWKDILGPNHAFVKIINSIDGKVEALDDYVMITVDANKLLNLKENKDKFDPKQHQKDDLKKFSDKMRDQVQGGPPTQVNKLKDTIKNMVREILSELEEGEYEDFTADTERHDDGGKPRVSELVSIVVDKFDDYQKSNDIDLEDNVKENDLNNFISNYLDEIGYGINDDDYNTLFYDVQDELKKLGYNFI